MSQDPTIKNFTDLYDIPYTVVTLLYSALLLLVSSIVAIKYCGKCCCKKCCYKCCNEGCFKAAKRVGGWVTSFNKWLIKLVFGKSEGVSEGKGKKPERNTDREGFEYSQEKGVVINNRLLDATATNILGGIIICFGLLVGITAYSAYLLDISHTCSEDPAIYCYPQLIDPSDPLNPNITQNESEFVDPDDSENLTLTLSQFSEPIFDCSMWTNSSIAPQITFQCFRFAFNAQAAMVVMGGLLAFFTIAARIIIKIILVAFKILQWCGKKCCGKRYGKRGDICCGKCVIALQVVVVIILLIVDVVTALVVMSFQLFDTFGMTETEANPVAQQTAAYIADNGVQFLIIVGTTTFLLLIDWRRYAWDVEDANECQEMRETRRSEN